MTRRVDVAIVGGGMVGASLAIALARACSYLRIAVLEAVDMPDPGPEPVYQPSYDARSTALSYGSRRIYEQLGLWAQLSAHVTPIEQIHVSDRGHFGASRLHAAEHRLPALGYVVENQWLGRVLWSALAAHPQIQFQCPVTVTGIQEQSAGVTLQITSKSGDQETLDAQLVVLADGGRSSLRSQLGIGVSTRAYDQMGLVANVTVASHHQFVAYERFTEQGPMALLPLGENDLSEGRCALIWTLPNGDAQRLLDAPDEEFLQHLRERFGTRLGRFTKVGARQGYPLALERSLEQVRPGLVLVGNAAHVLHPVAGQGYNLALREVQALAHHVAGAAEQGQWLGSLAVLGAFERSQQPDQERTVQFSDHLIRIFANDRPSWIAARGLGLMALDLIEPVRHTFGRYAMGMGGRESVAG